MQKVCGERKEVNLGPESSTSTSASALQPLEAGRPSGASLTICLFDGKKKKKKAIEECFLHHPFRN